MRIRLGMVRYFAVLAVSASVAPVLAPGLAVATSSPTVERIGGRDRFETAAKIAEETFPSPAHRYDAWLARGDDFPDALTASFPAGQYNGGGPLLLTPTGFLHPAVVEQLERLTIGRVWIMGSAAAVSNEVEAELQARGYETFRVQGSDRYGTAEHAAAVYPENWGVAIVATGQQFADALVSGAHAFRLAYPIVLTTSDQLHPTAERILRQRDISHVIIAGGTSAVSAQVQRDLEDICSVRDDGWVDYCIDTERIGGTDRSATAALMADDFVRRIRERGDTGFQPTHVNLARGDNFADAAAAGPHAGHERGPLLLTANPNALGAATADWLRKHCATIQSIHVFGTADAISNEVAEQARQAATCP